MIVATAGEAASYACLFHKAISQSGFARMDLTHVSRRNSSGIASAEELGKALAMKLGVAGDDTSALRAIPADAIVGAGDPDLLSGGGPMIDGKIVTDRIDAAFGRGEQVRVPYLLGSNELEFPVTAGSGGPLDVLTKFSPQQRAQLVSAYDSEAALQTNIISDPLFTEPASYPAIRRPHRDLLSHGRVVPISR